MFVCLMFLVEIYDVTVLQWANDCISLQQNLVGEQRNSATESNTENTE